MPLKKISLKYNSLVIDKHLIAYKSERNSYQVSNRQNLMLGSHLFTSRIPNKHTSFQYDFIAFAFKIRRTHFCSKKAYLISCYKDLNQTQEVYNCPGASSGRTPQFMEYWNQLLYQCDEGKINDYLHTTVSTKLIT